MIVPEQGEPSVCQQGPTGQVSSRQTDGWWGPGRAWLGIIQREGKGSPAPGTTPQSKRLFRHDAAAPFSVRDSREVGTVYQLSNKAGDMLLT